MVKCLVRKEERCPCGKLLLRKTAEGLELKCHRCKRFHVISLERFISGREFDVTICCDQGGCNQ